MFGCEPMLRRVCSAKLIPLRSRMRRLREPFVPGAEINTEVPLPSQMFSPSVRSPPTSPSKRAMLNPPFRSGQHKLTFLAKSTGDWTRKLNSIAASHMAISEKGGFGVGRTVKLSVEGAPKFALSGD